MKRKEQWNICVLYEKHVSVSHIAYMLIWITVVSLAVVSHRSQLYSEEVYIFIYTLSATAWIHRQVEFFNYNECIYEKWIVIFAHLHSNSPAPTTLFYASLCSLKIRWWVYYLFIHVCFAFLTVTMGGILEENSIEKRIKTWNNKNVEYELIARAEDGMMRWDEMRHEKSLQLMAFTLFIEVFIVF